MKKEREKVLEKKLKKSVKGLGGWSFKLGTMHIRGLPDQICLLPKGVVFFAEIKETGLKPTKLQQVIHKKIRSLGFEVVVVDSTQIINNIITKYENKMR